MATRTRLRGSQKLVRGHTLDARELAALTRLTASRGVKVVDWTILGQPAADGVRGTVHVAAPRAGTLVAQLLRLRRLRLFVDVFPLGIPVPRQFEIRFRQ